jgi:N-hydroxyarylamine O-acetyltransferase
MSLAGEWKPLYRFTLEPQFPADYEVSNWHLCHHPSSFFREILMCARAGPGVRYALRNGELAIHRNGKTEKRKLDNGTALRACLETDFGLQLPDTSEVADALDRVSGL